jgi:hypothetical protein
MDTHDIAGDAPNDPDGGDVGVDPEGDDEGYWAEQPLGEDWTALYRFVWQPAGPVLAEVHVVPRGPLPGVSIQSGPWRGAEPGSWQHFLQGSLGHLHRVPRGGLTTRELRGLRPQGALGVKLMDPREAILLSLHPHPGWQGVSARAWRMHQERLGMVPATGTGRPFTRLERLAQVAELYAEGSAAGSRRLNAEVAEALGRTPAQVRDDVYAARREGLLTDGPGRGRSGGSMTPKARAILDGLRTQTEPTSDR